MLFWEGITEAFFLLARGDRLVLDAAWRSVWVSVLATVLASAVGIVVGSVLARRAIWGRSFFVLALRAGMAVPTVLIGLVGYGVFSRRGILGGGDWLYTPWAIVAGEFCLAVPIVVTWTHESLSRLDSRLPETARQLGAGVVRRWFTYLRETRSELTLAGLTAFSRCATELGIAMMLGGNLKYRTRTLATATALETARGEFARGIAMGVILLGIALTVAFFTGGIIQPKRESP